MRFRITLPHLQTSWRWTLEMRACWTRWHLLPRALSSRRQRLRPAVLPRMPSFRVTCWKTLCRSMQGTHFHYPCFYFPMCFPAGVKFLCSWGAMLRDITQEVKMPMCRVFRHIAEVEGGAGQPDTRDTFKQAYDLGVLLMGKHASAGGVLPQELDARTAAGHLMRTCMEQLRLSEAPAATSADAAGAGSCLDSFGNARPTGNILLVHFPSLHVSVVQRSHSSNLTGHLDTLWVGAWMQNTGQ